MDEIDHEIRRCGALNDESLRRNVEVLAGQERTLLAEFLIHIAELDCRDACERYGFSSVFAYLTRGLGYCEWGAIARIKAARAASRFPSIYRMLKAGEVHLTALMMLEPHLNSENHRRLLLQARGKRKHEIDRLVADLRPAAREPRDRIRALPAPPPTTSPNAEGSPPTPASPQALPGLDFGPAAADPPPEPTPPSRSSVPAAEAAVAASTQGPAADAGRQQFAFVASAQVHRWFLQARDLLRHRFPRGRMEDIIGEALRRLVEAQGPGRAGRRRKDSDKVQKTRRVTRRVPRWVREEVWRRDEGRCSYVGPTGLRCAETAWLEFDHVVPWACGGASADPAQIRLLCRRHNASEARRILGGRAWARRRAPAAS